MCIGKIFVFLKQFKLYDCTRKINTLRKKSNNFKIRLPCNSINAKFTSKLYIKWQTEKKGTYNFGKQRYLAIICFKVRQDISLLEQIGLTGSADTGRTGLQFLKIRIYFSSYISV